MLRQVLESILRFLGKSQVVTRPECQEVVLAKQAASGPPPRICSEISLNGPLPIYDLFLCIYKFLLPGK